MTEWLRADVVGNTIGVDRNEEVIRGYVIAQAGVFKDLRGEFDHKSLRQIVRLAKASPAGLKSRFAHPTLSDDGIGKFLGRSKNIRMDTVLKDGQEIEAVRGDLHLDPSSHKTPAGDLGGYVLDLAESDPDALSCSLALETLKEAQLDSKGRPKLNDQGQEVPPLWRPTALHASDIVDTGDAVDGLLSAHNLDFGELPDAIVRQGVQLLDEQFAGATREVIEARCTAWLRRYLDGRFGEQEEVDPPPVLSDWLTTVETFEKIRVWIDRLKAAGADDLVSYDPAADPELRRRQLKRKGVL